MGIFSIFKKKTQEPEPEIEEIKFNEIGNWLKTKTKEIDENENEIFNLIKEHINTFAEEINKKIKILEAIDINLKKVEGRTKILIKQSLTKYLEAVQIFINKITEIEKSNLNQFIKNTNQTFSGFEKQSYKFYQRTTFLIGDEILAVKQEIVNLHKYFIELFNKNQKITNSSNTILSIKLELQQFNETNTTLDKINSEIKLIDGRIADNKEKEKRTLQEIQKTKTSKEYTENIEKQKQIQLSEAQLRNDISNLKTLIDFKALSNTHHSNTAKMKTISDHKENFGENITKNNGENILNLLAEAKINNNIIAEKIKQINETKRKIIEDKNTIKKDETKTLSEEIQKIKSDIENLNTEKARHKKRKENTQENKENILTSIKKEATKLYGNIIE